MIDTTDLTSYIPGYDEYCEPKEYIDKAKNAGINPNKLLAQAGNAMIVNVIYLICRCLLKSINR